MYLDIKYFIIFTYDIMKNFEMRLLKFNINVTYNNYSNSH